MVNKIHFFEMIHGHFKNAHLKFRYSKKAQNIRKNLPLCFDVTKLILKNVGDFFKFFNLLTINEL